MNNNSFQKERQKYIGGTDCAGILGLSKWKTPLRIWAEKTGQIEPADISDKICVKVGIELEELVAKLFCEQTGKKVRRKNATIFHKDYSFIAANIDRRIVNEDSILECKTASAFKAKDWSAEDIPKDYIMQCLHYLAVMPNIQKCYIAVLIGNQDFKWKEIDRKDNEDIIKIIIDKEVEFWEEFVINQIMPGISSNDSETLTELYPNSKEKEIILHNNVDEIINHLNKLDTKKKKLISEIELKQNEIKILLKDNERAKTDKHIITWKTYSRHSLDNKTLQSKHKEIYLELLKTTQYKRLSFKTIGGQQNV